MTNLPRQLSLAVRFKDRASFSNFYPGSNCELISVLQSLSRDPDYKSHFPGWFISGPSGCGKSHLLFAVQNELQAQERPALYLSCDEITNGDTLNALPGTGVLCLDRINQLGDEGGLEQGLFNLFERTRDNAGVLVMAATRPATELKFKLKDLVSRLSQAVSYQLQDLTDEQKSQAFKLRAEARGMNVSPEVIHYILQRTSRDMHSLFNLLDHIDIQSLAEKRRITIPFLREQRLRGLAKVPEPSR